MYSTCNRDAEHLRQKQGAGLPLKWVGGRGVMASMRHEPLDLGEEGVRV